MPVATIVLIAQLGIGEVLGLGSGIGAVVGEVVALGLTTGIGHRDIGAMTTQVENKSGLGVEEVVVLVNVEGVVIVSAIGILVELVVNTRCLIVHMAILQVEERIPPRGEVLGGLHESRVVELMGVGIVVLVGGIGLQDVGDCHSCRHNIHVTKVVAAELLQVHASHNVPKLVLVVDVVHHTIGVLREAFATDEVVALHKVAIGVVGVHAKLGELVVVTELLVIAIAVGVMQSGVVGPMGRRLPSEAQDVMVLGKVIGGLVPIGTVGQLIAEGLEVAGFVLREHPIVLIKHHSLIQRVETAQAMLVHILISANALVHERGIVVASCYAAPRLARVLVVANVLITNLEIVAQPCQATVERTAVAIRAMHESVGSSVMEGTIEDEVVEEQACREVETCVISVVGSIRTCQLQRRLETWSGRSQ